MAILEQLMVRIGVDADRVRQDLGRVDSFFETHADKIAAAGAALGAGAGAAIGTGLSSAMEKEALGDKLAAQLGATGPEAARLGKVAGDLYSSGLGDGLEQVNEAVGAVVTSIDGMRSASNEAVQDMAGKALNLARAYELDVGRSMQVVGQIVKSGLVKDAGQGVDLLTASLQKVPAAVREDLVDALDEYSPFMEQIGIKGQKAFNLLVAATEKGAFGLDKTGDALKEFTLRATDMSTTSADAFKKIGLDQKQMADAIVQGGDRGEAAFHKIINGLLGIKDPTERANAAIALFGTPMEDLAIKDIPAFLKQLGSTKDLLGETAGAADNLGKTLNDNAQTGILEWQRKTEGALASMANMDGAMGETAQAAAGIGKVLLPIGSDLGGLAAAAFIGAQAFGPVAKGAAKAAVSVATSTASIVASGARAAASAVATAARFVASWVVMGVQSLIQAGRIALAWLIAMGPIALVIAAVIGLVALIILNWDKIKAAIGAAWDWVKEKTAAVWNAVVGFLKNHWDKILMVITGPIGILVGLIVKNWDKIKAITSAAWNAIKSAISNAWNTIKDAVISGNARVVSLVKSLPGKIKSAVGNLGSLLWNAGKSVVQGLWNGIKAMGGWLASQIWGWIKAVIPDPIEKFLGIASPSKLMAERGRDIAAGLALGMRDGADMVARASGDLAATASYATPAGIRSAGGSGTVLEIHSSGSEVDDLLVEILRRSVRDRGGDVQVVLGAS